MRKARLLIILLLFLAVATKGANYKILKMNHPQILINGKQAKIGDVFSDNDYIRWSKDNQAMRVIDIASHKRYLFVAHPHEKREQKVIDIFIQINHLSTHGPNDQATNEFDKLENSILNSYDLFDLIEIPTSISVDDNHYFIVSYKYGDVRITKRLKYENGYIIIDKSIFSVDNKKLEPRDIEIAIDYVVKSFENTIIIKDGIELTIIPDNLQ